MDNFITAYVTDVGIKKETNQDSLLLNGIRSENGEVLFAALCDGMGGIEKGELASATVIRELLEWFQYKYAHDTAKDTLENVRTQWEEIVKRCNDKLIRYGDDNGIQLGTTMTVLMVYSTGEYIIGHVGDTRVYKLTDKIEQLTEDQTFIAREVKRGNMTQEEAENDSRRNVLLQCVGVNQYIEPQFIEGHIGENDSFVICSDGFRHEISDNEIYDSLNDVVNQGKVEIEHQLIKLVELNKQRGETDNISVIYIRKVS